MYVTKISILKFKIQKYKIPNPKFFYDGIWDFFILNFKTNGLAITPLIKTYQNQQFRTKICDSFHNLNFVIIREIGDLF
jgi:hypothetical protein